LLTKLIIEKKNIYIMPTVELRRFGDFFSAQRKKKNSKEKNKRGLKITMVVTKDMLAKPKSSRRALKLSQRIAYLSVLYVTGGGMPGASIEKRGQRGKSLHCHH
jgi:hypothetical protein